jgi:hypothetical protein
MSRTDEAKFADDGTRTSVEKTASKLKINHGDCTTSYGFANDKMSFDAKGKAYNEDGWISNIGFAAETKQAKSEWKASGSVEVKSPDLSGAKLGLNVSYSLNRVALSTSPNKICGLPPLVSVCANKKSLVFSGQC